MPGRGAACGRGGEPRALDAARDQLFEALAVHLGGQWRLLFRCGLQGPTHGDLIRQLGRPRPRAGTFPGLTPRRLSAVTLDLRGKGLGQRDVPVERRLVEAIGARIAVQCGRLGVVCLLVERCGQAVGRAGSLVVLCGEPGGGREGVDRATEIREPVARHPLAIATCKAGDGPVAVAGGDRVPRRERLLSGGQIRPGRLAHGHGAG